MTENPYQIALAALADIGHAEDLSKVALQAKARRIYQQLITAPPFSVTEWHAGYEVGYREGESSHRADMEAAREESGAAGTAEQAEQWTNAPEWVRALYLRWSVSSRLETQRVLDDVLASAALASSSSQEQP